MNPTTLRRAARLAVNLCSAITAHNAGDYWIQHGTDAVNKGAAGSAGRARCLRHVAGYTATHALVQPVLNRAVGIRTRPGVWLAGHLGAGIAHYVMDRSRESGRLVQVWDRTAGRLPGVPAKREFWDRGGHVELDQSWHWVCLMAWAAVDAVASERTTR